MRGEYSSKRDNMGFSLCHKAQLSRILAHRGSRQHVSTNVRKHTSSAPRLRCSKRRRRRLVGMANEKDTPVRNAPASSVQIPTDGSFSEEAEDQLWPESINQSEKELQHANDPNDSSGVVARDCGVCPGRHKHPLRSSSFQHTLDRISRQPEIQFPRWARSKGHNLKSNLR